jgi:hypothetical protein
VINQKEYNTHKEKDMENRYQNMKATFDSLNDEIEMVEIEISSILLRILELAGFNNKKVSTDADLDIRYRDRYNKTNISLLDLNLTAHISHRDIKLLSPKASVYEQLGNIVEFLKRFFDIDNKNTRSITIYNSDKAKEASITFYLFGIIGKLYELSELDDDSLKLLIELKK